MPETDTELPTALALPVLVGCRNAEQKVDVKGHATRMDERGFVATFPQAIPDGTVLFTTVDMRSVNAVMHGLSRVRSQTPMGENAGFQTFADFIDINEDARAKLARLAGGHRVEDFSSGRSRYGVEAIGSEGGRGPIRTGGAVGGATAGTIDYNVAQADAGRAYFEPAPLRAVAKPTTSTKFWNSLGVTAYVAVFLIVVALFPQGRAFELLIFGKIAYALERTWYWANHIGQVKLYNNT
jgi:hypothetical protein